MEEPLVGLDLLQRVGKAGNPEDLAAVGLLQRVVHRPGHHPHSAPSPGRHVLLGGDRLVDQDGRDADKEPEELFQQDWVHYVSKDGHTLHQTSKSRVKTKNYEN